MTDAAAVARVSEAPLILVVDDDPALRRMIRLALASDGFEVALAEDGEAALRLAPERAPAAILLDVRLSDGPDGQDVLSALKARDDTPVIVVSGDSDEALRIACMERGADEFLDKPFAPDALERHLRYLLRHDEAPPDPDIAVRIGDLSIDMTRQVVFRDGAMIRLSLTTWTLLELLITADGEAVLYRELLTHALGRTHARDVELLRVCIERLRSKVDSPTSGSKIVDFHGVGYALGYAPQRARGGGGK